MKGWFWAVLLLPLSSLAHAEEPVALTLEQSLQEAQNHSPYYQKAQAMEREAGWGQLEAWSEGFLPNITVKGQYFLPNPQYGELNVQFGGAPKPITFPGIYPEQTLAFDEADPKAYRVALDDGTFSDTIEVQAWSPEMNREESTAPAKDKKHKGVPAPPLPPPSPNVFHLQQRVAGVLPIAVDVPRTGTSYRFLRPLVVNEETNLSFAYKSK